MSLFERIVSFRGSRSVGLLEPGERTELTRPRLANDGIRELAADLGLDYHDEALVRDAVERRWREENQ